MDVTGIPLTGKIAQSHLQEMMEPGEVYKREELVRLVDAYHEENDGAPTNAKQSEGPVKKALAILKARGIVENPASGQYRMSSDRQGPSLSGLTQDPGVVDQPEVVAAPAERAEIMLGDGAEQVYGWYLPAYRELARSKGEDRFPVKVGRTERTAEQRISESAGSTAPERPVLGLLLRVDDSTTWERFIHSSLTLDGRRLPDAVGNEWFSTNLAELRDLVETKLAAIRRAAEPARSTVEADVE